MRDGFPVRFGTSARGIAQHPNDVVNFAPAVMRGAFFARSHLFQKIFQQIFLPDFQDQNNVFPLSGSCRKIAITTTLPYETGCRVMAHCYAETGFLTQAAGSDNGQDKRLFQISI
jgi:hypothetical protein